MLKFLTDWWPYIAGVVGALWVAWTYFDTRAREKAKPAAKPTVSASNGSFAAGRDLSIGRDVKTGAHGADTPPAAP